MYWDNVAILQQHPGCNKFKYDHIDSKWIVLDCINSTVTMNYNATNKVYTLDRINVEELEKFVTERNA